MVETIARIFKVSPNTKREIPLDKNENPYGPAPECVQQIRTASKKLITLYQRNQGLFEKRLSEVFGVKEDNILVSYGAEELLKDSFHFFLEGGGKVAFAKEAWWYYNAIADEVKAKVVHFSMKELEDRYEFDTEQILKTIKDEKIDVLLLCSPNNPTGNSLKEEELIEILKASKNLRAVILDEAYWGFSTNHYDIPYLIDKFPNLLVLRTFSKFFGLAGLRVGFAFYGDDLTDFALRFRRYLGYNRLAESVALAALSPASIMYYKKIAARIMADRELIFKRLSNYPELKPFKSNANFILVKADRELIEYLFNELLSRYRIRIRPFLKGGINSHFRITIGTHKQTLYLLKAIDVLMRKWRR